MTSTPANRRENSPPGCCLILLIRRTLGHSLGPVAFAAAMIESFNGSLRNECLTEEIFDSLAGARQKLALWRYDDNNARPHSSLGNQTPVRARRALELPDGPAPAALAQPETDDDQQTRLSL